MGATKIYRVSQKKLHLVLEGLNFELRIKVGGVLESGSQLFKTVPTFDF